MLERSRHGFEMAASFCMCYCFGVPKWRSCVKTSEELELPKWSKSAKVGRDFCADVLFRVSDAYALPSLQKRQIMRRWKNGRNVNMLLQEYGLSFMGSLDEKRAFAMGVFLWTDQLWSSAWTQYLLAPSSTMFQQMKRPTREHIIKIPIYGKCCVMLWLSK